MAARTAATIDNDRDEDEDENGDVRSSECVAITLTREDRPGNILQY